MLSFVEATALRSIVLRYAGVPIVTHTCFFLSFPPFVHLEMSLFPSIFCTTIGVLSRRTFFPSELLVFFYLVATGWIFDISLLFENSNQSKDLLQ